VRDLEDGLVRSKAPANETLRITALSLAHGVLCRFTAFLAVDEAVVINPGGLQATLVQPVEMPGATVAYRLGPQAAAGLQGVVASPWMALAGDSICCSAPVDSCLQARSAPRPRVPHRAAVNAAGKVLTFLETLEPTLTQPESKVTFPAAFFRLGRLLEHDGFAALPAAQALRAELAAAGPFHGTSCKGGLKTLRRLLARLRAALEAFLAETPVRRSKSLAEFFGVG
jgi:hypothetical protein